LALRPNMQDLKSGPFFWTLFITGALFFLLFSPDGFPADWKIYAATDEGQFYYDEESIIHPFAGTVKFRHKVVFSEKGIRHFAESLGSDYENLSYAVSVREILCSEKKVRSLGVTYFSNNGDVLDQAIDSESEWHWIESSAMIAGLYQKVCK
jgi:hypothetical protein